MANESTSLLRYEYPNQSYDINCTEEDVNTRIIITNQSKITSSLSWFGMSISLSTVAIIFAILNVIIQCGLTITAPILLQILLSNNHNCPSSPYFMLLTNLLWGPIIFWFIAIVSKLIKPSFCFTIYTPQKVFLLLGILHTLFAFLSIYASPPSRTSPSLQGILRSSTIPFTVLLRYILLGKRTNLACSICTFGTIIGLIISLEPNIFNIDGLVQDRTASSIWPFIFALAFLPYSAISVLQEREIMKDSREEAILFEAWSQTYNFIFVGLLFWTDLIPGLGQSKTLLEFQHHMNCGFMAEYSGNSITPYPWAAGIYWAVTLFYCSSKLFSLLLIRYTDGANYLVIVQALATPIVAIFWTLFSYKGGFHWQPHFTVSTGFIFVGILIIVPCIILYNYNRESKVIEHEEIVG